jgi:hypothetical protein
MQTKLGESVLVVGKCVKDAEYKRVGAKDSPVTSFSLNVGKRQDTTTIFVNCKAWYALAEYSKEIRKGDAVIVIGRTESREYNGKTYTDLIAEWINFVSDTEPAELSPSGVPYPKGATFEESDSKKPLPF